MNRIITITLIAFLASGCATITRGSKDVLNIETTPQGAQCSLSNGYYCASTPCSIEMPRKSQGVVTCDKDGYVTGTGNFTNKTAGAGAAGMAGNVLVGGLIGAAVDGGTGAMKDLTPNPIQITLEKQE
jgi:hypothetical protein